MQFNVALFRLRTLTLHGMGSFLLFEGETASFLGQCAVLVGFFFSKAVDEEAARAESVLGLPALRTKVVVLPG
jgi:hypothetical protein